MKRKILIGAFMFMALIGGQSVQADLNWCGSSFFFVGSPVATATWYTGSNSYNQPGGKLDGTNLGAISTLFIGGQVQTFDQTFGTLVALKYKLDQVAAEYEMNVAWSKNEGNNQVWQSAETTDILVGKNLAPGPHSAQFWYHAKNGTANAYDNNGNKNYKVTFTVPGLVMPTTPLAFATNIEVGKVDIAKTINIEGYGLVASTPVTLALSGTNAKDFTLSATSVVLSADKGSFTVNFTPLSEGVKSATVTATYGDYTRSFTVTGIAIQSIQPTIAIAPITYTFPKQAVGTAKQTTLVVTGFNLTSNIVVSGEVAPFSVTPNLTINGGTIEVTYTPLSAGSHTMTLTLTSGVTTKEITINATAGVPITTRFKVPEGWGSSSIYLYTKAANIDVPYNGKAWPGVAIETVNGWCSYTLPVEVETINVIFNNNNPTTNKKKTADIMNITASANYMPTGKTTPGSELMYEVATTDYPGTTPNVNWDVKHNGGDVKIDAGGSLTIASETASDAIINNLTLPAAPAITINNGGKLVVTGDITLSTDGDMSSEIVNEGSMSLVGKMRVRVSIAKVGTWQFVSLPFEIAKVYKADGITEAILDTDYYINAYDGSLRATGKKGWIHATDLGGIRNFIVATESQTELVFESATGAPDINQISKASSVTLEQNPIVAGGGNDDGGWNLVTHPSIRSAQPTLSDHKLYLYKADRGYEIVDNSDPATITKPFQSYFVKYTKTESPFDLTLAYTTPIAKSGLAATDNNVELFGLQLSQGDTHYNTTKFRVRPEATTAFEVQYDASMILPFDTQLPQIYSISSDNKDLGINSLPESTESTTIGVRLEAGTYTISTVGTPMTLTLLELYDKQTATTCNLLTIASYTFDHPTSGDIRDRFVLRTSRISTGVSTMTDNGSRLWAANYSLKVESTTLGSQIQIIDLSGVVIYQGFISSSYSQYSLPSKGVYLVKIADNITKVVCN